MDEDLTLTEILDNRRAHVVELIHLARIDRDALDAEKALAASEKAMYESRIASMETRCDAEVEWVNTLKRHHHEKDRIIITMLTSHLPVDKAAETVALFKSKDEQLNVQGRFIDAYRTQNKCGLQQMAEIADMYRTSLTDQADDHQSEITKLYERITELVEAGGNLKDKLRCIKKQNVMHVATIAAKDAEAAAKSAAHATMMEAYKNSRAALAAVRATIVYGNCADVPAAIAAALSDKDAEIARLKEELAASSRHGAMET